MNMKVEGGRRLCVPWSTTASRRRHDGPLPEKNRMQREVNKRDRSSCCAGYCCSDGDRDGGANVGGDLSFLSWSMRPSSRIRYDHRRGKSEPKKRTTLGCQSLRAARPTSGAPRRPPRCRARRGRSSSAPTGAASAPSTRSVARCTPPAVLSVPQIVAPGPHCSGAG